MQKIGLYTMTTGVKNTIKCPLNALWMVLKAHFHYIVRTKHSIYGVESTLALLSVLHTLSTWWLVHSCIMKCALTTFCTVVNVQLVVTGVLYFFFQLVCTVHQVVCCTH